MELATSDCDMDIKDKDGRLPLHLATIRGHLECCSYLSARNSADINCQDLYGRTPFFYACKGKANIHSEIADLFLDDSDISLQDKKLLSPLHYAVMNYHKSLIKRMLYSITDVNVKDISGVTPLMVAAGRGYLSLVKILVKRGADCNLLDSQQRNAYLFAKIQNKENCAAFLEPKTSVKEMALSMTTDDVEILHKPTK
jgi:ankyrin repeat protein